MATETCLVCGGSVNSGSGQCEACGHLAYGELVGDPTFPADTTIVPTPASVPVPYTPPARKGNGLPGTAPETCNRCVSGTVNDDGVCEACGHNNYA